MSAPPASGTTRRGALHGAQAAFVSVGILPVLLVVAFVVLGSIEPRFLSGENLFNVARQSTFLVVVAMGQMLVLLTGNFDLSVGSNIAMVSVTTTLAMAAVLAGDPEATTVAILCGVAAGLGVGAVIGAINGFGVAVMKVHSFIMTLGMLSVAYGTALMVTDGLPVTGLPPEFTRTFAYGRFLGLPAPVIATLLLFGLLFFLLSWTRFGRHLYAIGSNPQAARLSGIGVARHIFLAHLLCSLVVACGAILLTARVGTGEAQLGAEFALASITACVLGGVSLAGGSGLVINVLLGAFFLTILKNGMTMMRVGSYAQIIADGSLLIFAIWAEQLRLRMARQLRRL